MNRMPNPTHGSPQPLKRDTIRLASIMEAIMPAMMARDRVPKKRPRWSVGTTVAGGMAFATFLNVLFIPVLYVVVQSLRGSGPTGRATDEEPARA